MAKKKEQAVEDRLRTLYSLQEKLSEIDEIKTLRGELPLEVADLEDEIIGLETRIKKQEEHLKEVEVSASTQKQKAKDSSLKVAKYTEQLDNVRNNREFDHLSKEIEFEKLEVELAEKRVKEFTAEAKKMQEDIQNIKSFMESRKADLAQKKEELDGIIAETKQQEESLRAEVKKIEEEVDDRLLTAFKRIRKSARNGLGVVLVERGACGGCFNKIPPQRQLDVKLGKKVIVCEYCGRIMVDPELVGADLADAE